MIMNLFQQVFKEDLIVTPRIQVLTRPTLGHIGSGIPVTKHWYDVIELCVKSYVSNNEREIAFVVWGRVRDSYRESHTLNWIFKIEWYKD